jgi:hypothetical protein
MAECSGGITSSLFSFAVVPLLHHTTGDLDLRALAVAALVRLCTFKATPSDSEMLLNASFSSPAARCAVDPLCIVFSMLSVPDYLVAQRCCRSWRAVRLHAASWPEIEFERSTTGLYTGQLQSVRWLRELLDNTASLMYNCDRVIQRVGLIENLIKILESDDSPHELQLECLSTLRNLAAGNPKHTRALVQSGIVPCLARFLKPTIHTQPRHVAVSTLKNLVATKFCREQVIRSSAFPDLLTICAELPVDNAQLELLRTAMSVIMCLCKHVKVITVTNTLPMFVALLSRSEDKETLGYVAGSLFYLTSDVILRDVNTRVLTRTKGLLEVLLKQLTYIDTDTLRMSFLVIGRMLNTHENAVRVAIGCGLLDKLAFYIAHAIPSVQKDAYRVLIVVSRYVQVQFHQKLLDAELLPALFVACETFSSFKQQLVTVLVETAMGDTHLHAQYRQGLLPTLGSIAADQRPSQALLALKVIEGIIDGMQKAGSMDAGTVSKVLASCGGVQKLLALIDDSTQNANKDQAAIIPVDLAMLRQICFATQQGDANQQVHDASAAAAASSSTKSQGIKRPREEEEEHESE